MSNNALLLAWNILVLSNVRYSRKYYRKSMTSYERDSHYPGEMAYGQRPTREGSTTVALLPHETRLLHVQEDLFGNGSGAMSRLGGISVEHNGPAGAVLARGFAQEPAKGYSLAVQFSDPQGAKSSAYQGAGLRLGVAGGEVTLWVRIARIFLHSQEQLRNGLIEPPAEEMCRANLNERRANAGAGTKAQ